MAKLASIHSQGTVLTFNKWEASVNTIDPLKTDFDGWKGIKDLPGIEELSSLRCLVQDIHTTPSFRILASGPALLMASSLSPLSF